MALVSEWYDYVMISFPIKKRAARLVGRRLLEFALAFSYLRRLSMFSHTQTAF